MKCQYKTLRPTKRTKVNRSRIFPPEIKHEMTNAKHNAMLKRAFEHWNRAEYKSNGNVLVTSAQSQIIRLGINKYL
jgi:hypothetical protein